MKQSKQQQGHSRLKPPSVWRGLVHREGTACAQGWVILKVWKYLWGRERVRRRLERWAGADLCKALSARPVR